MTNDRWREALHRTHGVVLKYASVEFESLARKAIWGLQQIEASDIFCDDYRFKTLWDEYCHYVQTGPYDLLENALETTLDGIIDELTKKLPKHAAILLSIGAINDSDEYDDPTLIGTIAINDLNHSIKTALDSIASSRSLDHFVEDF